MTPSEFQVEKTAIGLQYVIPGTKRIVKPKPRAFKADWTPAGDQFVIPGAEKISTIAYIARLAEKPLTPRRSQLGLRGMGLFDSQLK
jgi:hypothetical protein